MNALRWHAAALRVWGHIAVLTPIIGLTFLLVAVGPVPCGGQDLQEFQKRVTEFTLDNGLNFIVVERHEAPVFSYVTYADVGSVDERRGITGLAHFFEHMAFKGTTTVGTTNAAGERAAFQKEDEVFAEIRKERFKGAQADKARLESLRKQLEAAQLEAKRHIVPDEFEQAIMRAGGVMLNADTAWDRTRYYYSLPANKLELWMSLESDRFLAPVLREFYKERDVVAEERRLGENDPMDRLVEDFFATAFKAHPYGNPVIGHMSDIQNWTRQDAEAWFDRYYGANNLTIAVVGDIDPGQVKAMAQTYFGRLPKKPKPDPVETIEPAQEGERRCTIVAQAQPAVILGFHRPGINHPDAAVFDALTDVLSEGRTSRLYKSLVRDQRLAVATAAVSIHMAMDKYPNLFVFFAVAAQGHNNEENERALLREIERVKTGLVTPEELARARSRARAGLIRQLDSNMGLAQQLTYFQATTGDWRNLFRQLDQINAVTAEDIRRVANQYFAFKNRTVGLLIPESEMAGAN